MKDDAIGLRLAADLVLPADTVTSTVAVLGQREAGKSNVGVVMAEQMTRHGLPWVAIDPKGDWWGITLAADGAGPGLAIPVIGGRHGDVALDAGSGRALARLITDHHLSAIFDVSGMTAAATRAWVADFLEVLYAHNDGPRHVFFEEAAELFPQTPNGREGMRALEAGAKVVKLGRTHGLGATLLTQRAATLHNELLSQTKALILMALTMPADVDAGTKWWRGYPGSEGLVTKLRELPPGEGYVFSPGWLAKHGQPALRRVQFDRRSTFDSGATPAVGGRRPTDAHRAAVDLAALAAELAAAVDAATSDDPAVLRERIADLERQLADARSRPPVVVRPDTDRLAVMQAAVTAARTEAAAMAARFSAMLETTADQLTALLRADGTLPADATVVADLRPIQVLRQQPAPATARAEPGDPTLGRVERMILTALAQHGAMSTTRVAMLTGYSGRGGFRNALHRLRAAGLTCETDGGELAITPDGLTALGAFDPLPAGAGLRDWWVTNARLKPLEAAIFDYLLGRYPEPATPQAIADALGYSGRGGFRNALHRLCGLGVVVATEDGTVHADHDLAAAIGRAS